MSEIKFDLTTNSSCCHCTVVNLESETLKSLTTNQALVFSLGAWC